MKETKFPGFTAEVSLYQVSQHYYSSAAQMAHVGKNAGLGRVVPSWDDCANWAACCWFLGQIVCCQYWAAFCAIH